MRERAYPLSRVQFELLRRVVAEKDGLVADILTEAGVPNGSKYRIQGGVALVECGCETCDCGQHD